LYYLCSVLDGCSRYSVNRDLRQSMTEADIEVILERAKKRYPEAKPRIITIMPASTAPSATSRRRTCSPGQPEIHAGRDRKLEAERKQGRFVGRRPLEERRGPVSGPKHRMKWITSGGPIRAESLADALGQLYDKATFGQVGRRW
jgi:hypothetical protein